jgi:UDP-2,4-diacetamido-2,4,6-trideoxy-beta-L-altropyranose hydrolase
MRILVRVDSGPAIGSGHLVRCLTLAGELRRRGATVEFASRAGPGNLSARIAAAGFAGHELREDAALAPLPADPHALLDDAQQLADARATLALARNLRPDWVVVDQYALDARWERALHATGAKLLALDDLANRAHECDVLLDQNWYGAQQGGRYSERIPQQCRTLLGPTYALLAPEYAQLRRAPGVTPPRAARVFVYFGTADATNETGKVVAALASSECADLDADIVIGENHARREELLAACARNPRITVHAPQRTLAAIMARAGLAVGAGGTTSWERLCLGLPSVVTVLSFNQAEVVAALAASGAIHSVGDARDTDPGVYARAIASQRGAAVPAQPFVDGLGARRVAELLIPTAPAMLRLRAATLMDAGVLLEWRNEPAAVAMSLNPRPVAWAEHLAWLGARLDSDDHQFFIAEADGLPVGHLRLDYRGREAIVSYSLDPVVRGRNWSGWLVREALRQARRVPPEGFTALVRNENAISRRVFTRLGWEASTHDPSVITYRTPSHAHR